MLYVFPLFHYGTLAALLSATMISPFARRNVAWFPKESSRFMLELGKIALKNPVKLPIERNLYQIACCHLNITNVRTMISFLTDFFLSESALVLVDNRWTRQILLNMDPKPKVKPKVSSQDDIPQATGKNPGLTMRPSRPKGMIARRQRMMPDNIRLLQEGWECWIILRWL